MSPQELNAFAGDHSEYAVFEEETQYQHQKHAYEELEAIPSLTTGEPGLQNFYDSASVAAMGGLNAVDIAILDENYPLAASLNNSVLPANIMEENQQQFNSLYLMLLADEIHTYSDPEKEALYGIANQCPLEGGNAVWQARVLIWGIENQMIEFADNCTAGESRKAGIKDKTEQSISSVFKLYPNPNNGTMTLEYHLAEAENGLLSIYDVTGKQVKQIALSSKVTTAILNETDLEAGIYYYSILVNNKTVKTEKLIIIK